MKTLHWLISLYRNPGHKSLLRIFYLKLLLKIQRLFEGEKKKKKRRVLISFPQALTFETYLTV